MKRAHTLEQIKGAYWTARCPDGKDWFSKETGDLWSSIFQELEKGKGAEANLHWHEWTAENPPPILQQVIFTRPLLDCEGNVQSWLTGTGAYFPDENYVRGGVHLMPPSVGRRIYWARFNPPDLTSAELYYEQGEVYREQGLGDADRDLKGA